mmetsp:Transcript_13175/g.28507  ORF Transcript_13175/g.28507 Transcript_13175/m.28507 type:complete len:520 (-) Transcript_13175:135-1694(-)|eukprot:CAMPEP_0172550338 /NCGR_PEP_ID=MMETSP1067-20121228/28549_1 /TAXON_ID=265564 ORGANISM="Thalassiosira punctigera, Strain Tpunct2005C2" /NCGR_SAMPLE_ID=MMETSP1067 /ASSEMBLY_ACC=CAM_ASM_000444 /LENGTH=519 /DNA_ID=CAMNT_0013337881 /DNA_START=151 /DNA_END=1710 /DNA_ORIENTATION=+
MINAAVALALLLGSFCGVRAEDEDAPGGVVTSSKLNIHVPKSLTRPGGYEHREALFGIPPYGGSIAQNMYYADADLCDFGSIDTHAGYPIRAIDEETGTMLPWQPPFILMVDRGGCTFVQKVRNAQRVGAAGVIIADNTCLCSAGDSCHSDPGKDCEEREPIMADDGSGSDISIPSFLMFKQDADPVKAEAEANHPVRLEMTWALPSPDDRVEYELWTTPTDVISRDFQKEFKMAAVALGKRAYFTPQMYIYDGVRSGCQGVDGENDCYNLCTNNGRYCATDPDNDLDRGISGADVVRESLRRMCIWEHYGKDDGVGAPWWDYVNEFIFRCNTEEYFSSKQCAKDAMSHAGVDPKLIDRCMKDSGGLEDDAANEFMDIQIQEKDKSGVVILPAMYVNRVSIRGSLEFPVVFKAICAGYASGTVPSVCTSCASCNDQKSCITNGFCGSKKIQESVSTMNMFYAMAGMAVVFCVFSFIQHRRYQSQMQAQVKGIIAEYMPLESDQNQNQSTAVSEEDGEFT